MASPTPFKVAIPQEKLDLLKQKLSLTSFPTESSDVGWERGCPLADVQRLTKAWQTFDWRAAEAKLNEVPQFTTPIGVDGFGEIDVHFVWQRSSIKCAVPLLFVHGWPGSFIEVLKILPLLVDEARGEGPAFNIVAPSLPNFGFSQGVTIPGFGMAQYAECFHKLMTKLGYGEYVTQGGDIGYSVTRALGLLYPKSCKASHINLIPISVPPTWSKNPLLALRHAVSPYTEKEKKGLERSQWFEKEGRGYNLEQSTNPQTLAYALHDSPVALLSWIYEKLHDWSDAYPWTDDEILTWVSIYRFSRAGPGAAHRIYYESNHNYVAAGRGLKILNPVDMRSWLPIVKLGLSWNPKEIIVPPRMLGRTLGSVVYEADNESGGHFYAHERPEWLARDLRTMFGKTGGAFGVVKGREGY
ncbi:related to epoxide hydrolase [Phialocephala subalpina]|uniref:Related to epoxide hydrolase n=1 Tax=Phialocephala subalpina TaxID=576137 RepID=A0A1L7XUX8_9HELO|nr:related to epoxide hydrolase [Phialocephala subalpina]